MPFRTPARNPGIGFACLAALALAGILAACATKKASESPAAAAPPAAEAAAAPSPKPSSTPSPSSTPEEPRSVYRIKVSTEDGESEETVVDPDATPTPKASNPPAVVNVTLPPTPTPSPSPKGNFLSRAWQKVFPPKPTPTPGAPEVIKIKPPREGILSRLWHSIFPRKKRPPAAQPAQWLGTIRVVNEHDGYVLIDSQGFVMPPPGSSLRSVGGPMDTGSLKVSADRKPPFFLADIQSGKPQPGDKVYSPLP